jgi:hypothetical protein
MFTLWAFLFIFQGPVYYHLTIILIIVLLGYDREHFWKTLLVVSAGRTVGRHQPRQLAPGGGHAGSRPVPD